MNEKSYRIESVYTLEQPLSHIGESESTTTFLNTVRVLNNGKPEDCFAYTGNAIRGAWRDSGAMYMLERLQTKVPKKTFHLLFSGGSIGGEQSLDVEQAKAMRDMIPHISVFGGGVGNQILAGKFAQTFALPVCAETSNIIPPGNPCINYEALETSWRHMTGEFQFSRKDDGKAELGDKYMAGAGDQALLEGESKKKASGEAATQMRYAVEYLVPGAQLWHMLMISCSEMELGALVAAIHQWSKRPVLGGMSGKGFGLVDLHMDIQEVGGQKIPFIEVQDGQLRLADLAKEAKDQYDAHLMNLYNQMLDQGKDEVIALLEGGK